MKKKDPSVVLLVHDNNELHKTNSKIYSLLSTLKVNEKNRNINDSIIYSQNCRRACFDRKLKCIFKNGHKVILVKNLELLAVDSVFLFYSYGDNTSEYQGVLILISLQIPHINEIKINNLNQFVESYLLDLWMKNYNNEDQLKPIFTRIANNIVLI